MEIIIAQEKDLPEIIKLYEDYNGENMGEYKKSFNKEKVYQAVVNMITKNGIVLLAKIDDKIIGAVVGCINTCLFTDDIIFVSMFFYMKKKYGGYAKEFIKEISVFIKKYSVNKLVFASPMFDNSEKYNRFYKMLGFKVLETHFVKEI